jgi:hypothetical protein
MFEQIPLFKPEQEAMSPEERKILEEMMPPGTRMTPGKYLELFKRAMASGILDKEMKAYMKENNIEVISDVPPRGEPGPGIIRYT